MAQREIVLMPNPILRTACETITDPKDPAVRQLVEDLLENVNQDGRAGLAANQIGINLRAFAWNVDGDIGYILNPEITFLSETIQETSEGCLSIPGQYFLSQRADRARAKGIDLDSKPKIIEGEAIFAKMIQHECGHLKGQLFIDILTGDERKRALRELDVARF
jgi:peptide deformylase